MKSKIMEEKEEFSDSESGSSDQLYGWECLPDNILLHIFQYLDYQNLLRAGLICKAWNRISYDEFLWRDLFYSDFKINRSKGIAPGKKSWLQEYKRLIYHCPSLQTEVLENHRNQVLHVSFSHNGKYFATSSKDASIIIWKSSYPATVKFSHNMTEFSWMYTQFSQFNKSDTLLLVSGVHFGSRSNVSGSGEIAVFSLVGSKFQLQCRVKNKPYDIFGAWYSEAYLLSGNIHPLAHLVHSSELWLNKASQETESEHVPITNLLFRFYSINASTIRALLVSNAVEPVKMPCSLNIADKMEESLDDEIFDSPESSDPDRRPFCTDSVVSHDPISSEELPTSPLEGSCANYSDYKVSSKPRSFRSFFRIEGVASGGNDNSDANKYRNGQNTEEQTFLKLEGVASGPNDNLDATEQNAEERMFLKLEGVASGSNDNLDANGQNTEERTFLRLEGVASGPNDNLDANGQITEEQEELDDNLTASENFSETEDSVESNSSTEEDLAKEPEKYLIFTTGSKTCYPHQVGFKRIKPTSFPKRMPQGPSLAERIANREREREAQHRIEPNWADYEAVADRFDTIDHRIDLHGHVIGMALSPDHRFLYVNNRPWPKNYKIENPFEPPPIAQEIDIHVIDLTTFQTVGTMLRSHKAYTPNNECFLIFLDVSHDYVASGAEDKHGYLWDRHYGVCLAKFPHTDVVNAVAFNPQDPEMLVTTSDDFSIKVWRSIAETKKLLPEGEVSSLKKCVSVAHNVRCAEI